MRWVLSVLFWALALGSRIVDVRVVRAEKAARWLLVDPESVYITLADIRWLPDSP